MPSDPEATTTVATSRAIRAGYENDFQVWAEELCRLARTATGYRAAIRLGQTAGFQHLLLRFDNQDAADTWMKDPPVIEHVVIANRYSTGLLQIEAGNEVAFELPSDATASKWKRFATTWVTVFPVLLFMTSMIRMILNGVPASLQLLLSSLLLTATLQWVILPRLQRHTRFWLLQDQTGRLKN